VFQTAADRCVRQDVFTLGLEHIVKATEIRTAIAPAGWRHLAAVSDSPVAAHGRAGQTITSLTTGQQITSAVTTLDVVREWGAGQDKHYEIATLRIPGARIEAYWLRYLNGNEADDCVWPFLTLNRRLLSERFWPVKEFLAVVKEAAQRDLEFYKTDLAGVSAGPAPTTQTEAGRKAALPRSRGRADRAAAAHKPSKKAR
jgi:hypothetical protein